MPVAPASLAQREQQRSNRHLGVRLRHPVAETERRIGGTEPEIVPTRIKEQLSDLDAAQADLDALGPHTAAGSIGIGASVTETAAASSRSTNGLQRRPSGYEISGL
jgi:hypothetical protein